MIHNTDYTTFCWFEIFKSYYISYIKNVEYLETNCLSTAQKMNRKNTSLSFWHLKQNIFQGKSNLHAEIFRIYVKSDVEGKINIYFIGNY